MIPDSLWRMQAGRIPGQFDRSGRDKSRKGQAMS